MVEAPVNAQEERILASAVRQIDNWETRGGVLFMDVPIEQFNRDTLIRIVEICKQQIDEALKQTNSLLAELCPTHR